MSFTIFQNEKTPFQALKTTSRKSLKIDIFPKGLTHGFGPKITVFPTYVYKRLFFALQYRKGQFLGLNCLKNKVGKMAIFGPKPWVNPFWKMLIFRLFERLVFKAQKGVFSFQKIVKDIFLVYIALKKKWEKWPFLDQNHEKKPF